MFIAFRLTVSRFFSVFLNHLKGYINFIIVNDRDTDALVCLLQETITDQRRPVISAKRTADAKDGDS